MDRNGSGGGGETPPAPTPVHETHGRAGLRAASIGALGVVFGDIGTSPLYAVRESLEGHGHVIAVSEANVLGLLSLVFWSLVVVISVKYLVFVLRADNQGEGGILALTAQVAPDEGQRRRRAYWLVAIGLFGTALLYGDGMITPAISVLSAVEGTAVATDTFDRWVVPLACAILVGIFAVQRRGTAAIGRVFGPVMVVWFATLALIGLVHVVDEPSVVRALNPVHAAHFFSANGFEGFLALGSVFLVVTGGEALYADMGHFGRRPIQVGWFALVLPALVLNYFGQGALLIGEPSAIENPFYRLVPDALVLPLVVLATVATVIASQALISGAFSLTMQAVQLGYAPRFRIVHTSDQAIGQIYVPAVNAVLMVACIGLVVGFGSSTALAAAYGVAVTMTMVITTVLFAVVARRRFGWPAHLVWALAGGFLVVDLAFFGANVFKIPAGGWFPLVIGALVMTLLTTWRSGRAIVATRIDRARISIDEFVASLDPATVRVPGTSVFLFSVPGAAPPALLANHRHNRVLHERAVVVAITTAEVPRVAADRRATVVEHGSGVVSVVLHFGFMEEPDVCTGLLEGEAAALGIDPLDVDYFLGSEQLVVTERPGMARWREHLFAFMSRNATTAANYFGLPPDRTTIVGMRVIL